MTSGTTPWAGVIAAVILVAGMAAALDWLPASHTRVDMARVEQLLVQHGYPVSGFTMTPEPDLELVDAIAPPGCVDVWRTAHLAQLAIVRMIPAHTDESGTIGAAAAIAYAQDQGRLDCVGLAPQVTP